MPDTLHPVLSFEAATAAAIEATFPPIAVKGQPVHVFEREGRVALLHRHSLRLRFLDAATWARLGPDAAIAPLLAEADPTPTERPAPRKKVLQAVVTSHCNLRCGYCTVFHLPQPAHDTVMDEATLDMCARLVQAMDPAEALLILHGGEPLLAFEKCMSLADRCGVRTVMFTNGLEMTASRASELARRRVNVLVSLDGRPETHDTFRRTANGGPTFERSLRGFRLAQEAGCETGISLAIGTHNAERIVDEATWLVETLNPASIGLNLPHYTDAYTRCVLDMPRLARDLASLLRFALDRRLFLYPLAKFVRPLVQGRFKHIDCSALGDKIVVFPDGSRSNCISHTANALGPQDLDIWNHLIPMHQGLCTRCAALGVCGGGCLYDAQHFMDGCAYDARYCLLARHLLEFLIWDIDRRVGVELPGPEHLVPAYQPMGGVLKGRPKGLDIGIGHETDGR